MYKNEELSISLVDFNWFISLPTTREYCVVNMKEKIDKREERRINVMRSFDGCFDWFPIVMNSFVSNFKLYESCLIIIIIWWLSAETILRQRKRLFTISFIVCILQITPSVYSKCVLFCWVDLVNWWDEWVFSEQTQFGKIERRRREGGCNFRQSSNTL